MAQPSVIKWIAADPAAIALTQTLVAAGSLLLNGKLSVSNNPVVNLWPISRVITLTSINNLSAVNFTITGTDSGTVFVETIAGPNNNTVTFTNFYDSIISITTNGAVAAVSAGTGQTGSTAYFLHDYDKTVYNVSYQIVVTGVINYSLLGTLNNPNKSPIVAGSLFGINALTTNATTSQQIVSTLPLAASTVVINSSTANATLTETIIQQSIR